MLNLDCYLLAVFTAYTKWTVTFTSYECLKLVNLEYSTCIFTIKTDLQFDSL